LLKKYFRHLHESTAMATTNQNQMPKLNCYLQKILDYFLFTNIYISCIAVACCAFSYTCIHIKSDPYLLIVIFLSTMASYSFHWSLTSSSAVENSSIRNEWSVEHKKLLQIQIAISSVLICILFFYHQNYVVYLIPAGILTFIYSAPKIDIRPFKKLAGFAFGKTIYLASVWTYVVMVLPMLVSHVAINSSFLMLIVNRFCFIVIICILFDHRDRYEDIGIINVVTYLSKKQILFLIAGITVVYMGTIIYSVSSLSKMQIVALVASMILLLMLVPKSLRTQSDYWYYGVLDGCMGIGWVLEIMVH
jgi:hypothetical protein